MQANVKTHRIFWPGVSSLLILSAGLSQAWAYNSSAVRWRPVTAPAIQVAAVQRQQNVTMQDPRFRPVGLNKPQARRIAAPTYPQPMPALAQQYAPQNPWLPSHQPQFVLPPTAVQPQPMVTVTPPVAATQSMGSNKWRPVMPSVAAEQPAYAQVNSQTWRPEVVPMAVYLVPAMPGGGLPTAPNRATSVATPMYPQHQQPVAPVQYFMPVQPQYYPQYQAQAYPVRPSTTPPVWPQNNNRFTPSYYPAPVAQPWWQQGQHWQAYPQARPWPGQNSIAGYPS